MIRNAAARDNFYADPLHRRWREELGDATVTKDEEVALGKVVERYMQNREMLRHHDLRERILPEAEAVK